MRHRPVLSEAGAAFLVADMLSPRIYHKEKPLIIWEGIAALVARDYDWFGCGSSGGHVDEETEDVEASEDVEAWEDEEAWWSSSNEFE